MVMSAPERQVALAAAREVDPILKDLSEKKQHFRRSVASLAKALEEARRRLASQEQSFVKETLSRQNAESRAKTMEEEISMLHKNLDERNEQLQASTSAAEMYMKELDDLRLQLAAAKAIAEASALSAQSAQKQCSSLANELEEKSCCLREHEIQLDFLQKNLVARELCQMQLKHEVSNTMQELAKLGSNKHCNLANVLDEASQTSFDNIDDEEITELRDEIRIMSSHWKIKGEEMESELEKHCRAYQELKKRVMRLEFCLQEGRAQTRKLQRMEERKYRALKELRDQLVAKQLCQKQNFWESSGFKIIVSMSMLILVIFTKR